MNNLIAQFILSYPIEIFRREPIRATMRQLVQSQFQDPDELRQLQFQNVKRVLREAFSNIPHYRQSFQAHDFHPAKFKSLEDIRKVPFLEKTDLKNNMHSLLNKMCKGPLDKKTTGGSTGVAVSLVKDRIATAWMRGSMWRCYNWFGISQGDKQARFWGIPLRDFDHRKSRLIDYFMNRIRLSAFGFSDNELECYYKKIRKFKPAYFYGYISMILEFAYFLKKKGIDGKAFKLKAIISTAEVLYPHQKEFLETFFDCPVANEYGCGELSIIAFSCRRDSLHLMADNLLIEILDDHGDPVPPGGTGEIVITELHSTAMPLIRYRIKDFAKKLQNEEVCKCGCLLPIVEQILGREYDFLIGIDGKKYHGERFMYLLEDLQKRKQGVRQFQIVQTDKKSIVVNIIKEKWAYKDVEIKIKEFLHRTLGQEIKIKFKSVNYIDREQSGKIRLIIQKWGK